jgi:Tol biopolymer transport system component
MKNQKSHPQAIFIWVFLVINFSSYAQELPIRPARTISFSTNEGSNMNLDISPDGRTLVFDLLGDIYMLPATGGMATQITRGLALNIRPVWSVDGQRIAYMSDISGSFKRYFS